MYVYIYNHIYIIIYIYIRVYVNLMVFQAPFLHSLRLPDSPPGAAAHGISHARGPMEMSDMSWGSNQIQEVVEVESRGLVR